MSEKLFRFLLSELKTVRVRCAQCGGVAEVPCSKLSTAQKNVRCPGCGNAFIQRASAVGIGDLLNNLGVAVEDLLKHEIDLEFVIPDEK